jgi:hypothetical protein
MPHCRAQVFEQFKTEMVQSQPADVQQKMNDEFLKLMKDVTRSLDILNRDKFAQKLTIFRISLKDFCI